MIESSLRSRGSAFLGALARTKGLVAGFTPGWGARALVIAAVALGALVFAAPDAAAQGCAMCGTAISSSKDPLARGMFVSIIVMLAIPNLLLASIGGWIYYMYRRAAITGERT